MVRLRMTIPRRPGTGGFLSVEMNVHDDEEAQTIARALAYIAEGDVGLETDSGLYFVVKWRDLKKISGQEAHQDAKPPWEA